MRHLVARIPGPCLGLRRHRGLDIKAPEPLAEYVPGLARRVIEPEIRGIAGFDDPVDVPADANAIDQLVAFTGRNPAP